MKTGSRPQTNRKNKGGFLRGESLCAANGLWGPEAGGLGGRPLSQERRWRLPGDASARAEASAPSVGHRRTAASPANTPGVFLPCKQTSLQTVIDSAQEEKKDEGEGEGARGGTD